MVSDEKLLIILVREPIILMPSTLDASCKAKLILPLSAYKTSYAFWLLGHLVTFYTRQPIFCDSIFIVLAPFLFLPDLHFLDHRHHLPKIN